MHAGEVTRAEAPVLVTTAPRNPRDEQRDRQRRYLVTMGIRLACFVAAIVLAGVGLRWEAGLAIGASLVLPWVAVIVANGGPPRSSERPVLYEARKQAELDPPASPE
jgi:hypothetical protein